MTYSLSLLYSCGCADTWQVVLAPAPDEITMTCPEPCVPEHCGSCAARGRMCQDREGISRYKAVDFVEMLPAPRLIRRRARA